LIGKRGLGSGLVNRCSNVPTVHVNEGGYLIPECLVIWLAEKKGARIFPGAFGMVLVSLIYFMPEPLLALVALAPGSMLRMPSVAETATTEPSRPIPTTGK